MTPSLSASSEPRVVATPEALEVIRRLRGAHGELALFLSGGCCDGSSPICLLAGELPPGPDDLRLGELGETPFYIDRDQYERWRSPRLILEVRDGAAEGFSLEGLEGVRFVTVQQPEPSRHP